MFVDAKEAVQKKQIENALEKVEEGMKLVADQMKLIKIADRSEFGWKAANEYEQDEFASDSADEKRIFRSERRAERQGRSSQKKRRDSFMIRNMSLIYAQKHGYYENPAHKLLQGLQNLSDGTGLRQQKIGPCFKISINFQLTLFNPQLTFQPYIIGSTRICSKCKKCLFFVVSFLAHFY